MNTLDLMWFMPSVIPNRESRARVVMLALCLHLPHSYEYTSGLLNIFIFIPSLSDYVMSFYESHFVLLWKASILKIDVINKHESLMSADKVLVNFNVRTWRAAYREGLREDWEGLLSTRSEILPLSCVEHVEYAL